MNLAEKLGALVVLLVVAFFAARHVNAAICLLFVFALAGLIAAPR